MTKLSYHPTPEQLAALVAYARENGRTWKSRLNHDWSTGQSTGALQQVRNSFGPSWLIRFRLPKADGLEHLRGAVEDMQFFDRVTKGVRDGR